MDDTTAGQTGNPVVRLIGAGPRAPSDLSRQLRDIADSVDRGEVSAMVAAFIQRGSYEFLYASSLSDGVVMATLLSSRCVERMKA